MAKTRDYMDYLDDRIGIAPANSQEEFQAAETIVEVMKDHGLEPTIQEFDSRPLGSLMSYVLMIVLFVGVLLSGIRIGVVGAIGLILALVATAMLVAVHAGRDLFENFGPASRSQNVIAVHRAEGDKVMKGSRPIVIVAHYDTPHESTLYAGSLARNHALLKKASFPCTIVAGVAALLQVFAFLPQGLRTVVWIIGLVATLPLLVLAATKIAERFSPCTLGANDNKSSIAALLSVMDSVQPAEDRVEAQAQGRQYTPRGNEQAIGDVEPVKQISQVYGTRHGKEVLEQLGILPDTCEIVYETSTTAPVPAQEDVASEDDTDAYDDASYDDGAYDDASVSPSDEDAVEELEYEDDASYDDVPEDADMPIEEVGAEDVPETEEEAPEDLDDDYVDDDSYAEYEDDIPQDGEDFVDDDGAVDAVDSTAIGSPKPQGRIKRGLSSIRNFFSRKKHDEDEVSIPRGREADDVDFSEFEQTEWDEEDAAQAEDELKPIRREDFRAERLSWESDEDSTSDSVDDGEYEEEGYPEDAPEGDSKYLDDSSEVEDDAYLQGEDEPDVDAYTDAPASATDGGAEVDDGSDESIAPASAIDHESQQDWAIVDNDDYDEGYAEQHKPYDASLYQQGDESYDDLYEDDAEDLEDVEYELDEDQARGQQIRSHAQQDASHDDVIEEDLQVEDDYEVEESVDQGPEVPVAVEPQDNASDQVEDELSWDDEALGEYDDPDGNPDNGSTAELATNQAEKRGARARKAHQDLDDSDDSGVLPKDTRGLDTISDSYDVYEQAADQPNMPDPIDDPTWGQSSYVPSKPKVNVARRAALFDLPDPSQETADPLAEDDDDYLEDDEEADVHEAIEDDDPQDDLDEVDDGDDARQSNWKGGAQVRSDLRDDADGFDDEVYEDDPDDGYVDEYDNYEEESEPEGSEDEAYDDIDESDDSVEYEDQQAEVIDQDDLQDAILEMGDDYLVSHDIWFVAVGSSAVAHAGIKAFLSNFRQDIRGAFLINLDSIGAGTPVVMTKEGLDAGRRSDRRLVRLLTRVADDLHVELGTRAYDWDDTDATPAMRSRVRAVTIMGVDENGLPALSHSQNDVPDNVNPQQVSAIARLITEAIRRA